MIHIPTRAAAVAVIPAPSKVTDAQVTIRKLPLVG